MNTNYFKAADLYALAKAKAEQAAAELEAARLAVIAEAAGAKRLEGDAYAVEITAYDVERLSTTKAKEFLTKAQIKKCSSTTSATRLTIKPAAACAMAA